MKKHFKALTIFTGIVLVLVFTATIAYANTVNVVPVSGQSSVNLLDPSQFSPQAGVNLKVSSEDSDHPGVDALQTDGSGYWRNSSSNVYMSDYSPSSLALTIDLGAPKTIDKLYLEIPNTISNIQNNATRFEVYYSNDPDSWASAPTASDSAYNYDWKANGWTLAGGTETEGMWSYVNYNGQQWGYDTKTFLYPFTAQYVMINTVLVGPGDRHEDDNKSMMGISGLAIFGKDPVSNTTELDPAMDTYSTWDQVAPISTNINLASGQTLTSITKGDTILDPNLDYSFSGNMVTFASPYLAKLPLGTNEFTYHFNSGDSSIFALDVTARGYGENDKTIKMNAIEGVSPYNILGGAMGTDEPVEGLTKRIRDAYHEFYGDDPMATAADDHIQSVWDSILQKDVFQITAHGRGLNNEFIDKVRDGEYGHKGVFDRDLGYVVDGASIDDRQRIEIRPSEDSTGDFTAYDGDLVSYEWLWNIPDGDQWNQSRFRHLFQLKATNAQASDTLPGGNSGGENGPYIIAMSITGSNDRELIVNHNRHDGDKTLMRIPLEEIDSHWVKVEVNSLISDVGWLTIKITDTETGKEYTFDSPDVYQVFTNQGANDATKDLWRRPLRSGNFETEHPAVFDQYLRPKWGIYRSSNGGTNSAYDAQLQLADITISKVASDVSSVNLALNKKAYNVGPTEDANQIQMQSATANEYGNANKLTNGVLEDPTKWDVTNVTSLDEIGEYSWLGTDGARKGSFVIDLGQAMDFSQLRLFAKSSRLKGATVYVSDDFDDYTSSAEFDAMTFTQVERQTDQGYTYATGNINGGIDSADSSYPINLGKTYHSRYIKVTLENASGGNTGTDLTGPPRLTQVQVFNAPSPPQNLIDEASGSDKMLKWDSNDLSEGYTVYNGTEVFADLPAGATSYTLPSDMTDMTKIAVRSKGTDPYSRKFMISAPALLFDVAPPQLSSLKVNGANLASFNPNTFNYEYNWPFGTTDVVVSAESEHPVVIEQADYLFGTATITVTHNEYEELSASYTIQFRGLQLRDNVELPEAFVSHDIVDVAFSNQHGSHPATNAFDGNRTTRWASNVSSGPQWIQFDLGETKPVSHVLASHLNGHNRGMHFTIELSEDGENWVEVFDGSSTSHTNLPETSFNEGEDLELFTFEKTFARYLRYTGNGGTLDNGGTEGWNNLIEILIGDTYTAAGYSVQANGHFNVSGHSGFGDRANKVHIQSKWETLENNIYEGHLRINATPQGIRLDMDMNQIDWSIISETSATIQGKALDHDGAEYTVRLVKETTSGEKLSIMLWQDDELIAEALDQNFQGNIQIHTP